MSGVSFSTSPLPDHMPGKSRCCVLVGQMKTALLEILGTHLSEYPIYSNSETPAAEKFHPDRIIIESS